MLFTISLTLFDDQIWDVIVPREEEQLQSVIFCIFLIIYGICV